MLDKRTDDKLKRAQQKRERQARYRQRLKAGIVCARVELTARRFDVLTRLGHLRQDAISQREIEAAIGKLFVSGRAFPRRHGTKSTLASQRAALAGKSIAARGALYTGKVREGA